MLHNSPTIAIVEEGGVVAMNMGTWVINLSGLDHLGTGEGLSD
jgi:hypothetical protein